MKFTYKEIYKKPVTSVVDLGATISLLNQFSGQGDINDFLEGDDLELEDDWWEY